MSACLGKFALFPLLLYHRAPSFPAPLEHHLGDFKSRSKRNHFTHTLHLTNLVSTYSLYLCCFKLSRENFLFIKSLSCCLIMKQTPTLMYAEDTGTHTCFFTKGCLIRTPQCYQRKAESALYGRKPRTSLCEFLLSDLLCDLSGWYCDL